MKDVGKSHFDKLMKQILKYKIPTISIILVIGTTVGGFFTYRFYRGIIERQAQLEFVASMKYFEAPVQKPDLKVDQLSIEDTEIFPSNEEKWAKVEEVFKEGYEKNSSSGIAPLFLAFQSEALINLDRSDEAISVLKKAIGLLRDDTIKDSYQAKLSLMQLDSKDESVQKAGFELLQSMANKSGSLIRDLALYYLGEYYWVKKNFVEAKNYWSTLISEFGEKTKTPSEWAKLAVDKLKLIKAKI